MRIMVPEQVLFNPSSGYSLGVEIEFQILDKSTLSLAPLGPELESVAPDILKSRISQELIKSILEIQTGICADLRDVENDLLQTVSLAEELVAENGCLLYAASLHPFALAEGQERSSDLRYQRIMEELQIIGRRFISQGLHVHVGLADGDTAVRVCTAIQAYLPLFLALSASSPFYQAQDTGLLSYRTKLFESLPLAGMYDYLRSWHHFTSEVDTLIGYGIIEKIKDLWWDARPSPGFGTLEIRICDLPGRFGDILAIVALIQACVAWIAEEGIETGRLNSSIMKANKWQAVRYGLSGKFVDPAAILGDSGIDFSRAVNLLVDRIKPYAKDLNGLSYLAGIDRIMSDGNGADLQRRAYQKSENFKDVIQQGHLGFWK